MIEVSDSQLSRYAIHVVGNANEGTVTLSNDVLHATTLELEAAWTDVAFQKFEQMEEYRFFHESSLTLHDMYVYATEIFRSESEFLLQSQLIAKHLHNASTHPNIKEGELFVGLFENVAWVDRAVRVLAIMKIDDKETFINVSQQDGQLHVSDVAGISVKRPNNTALIVQLAEDDVRVFVRTRKKDETLYWTERFLQAKIADESYVKTNEALKLCKKLITKDDTFSNTEKIDYLTKTLDYFYESEQLSPTNYVNAVFDEPEEALRDTVVTMLTPLATPISLSAVEKAEKSYKRKIKLDEHIEIQVTMNSQDDVARFIETGIDESGRKYYKLYYSEES